MTQLGRLLTAMVTPFDQEGRVDYAQAERLALALVESGSDGVVLAGTTGESPTLTVEEKLRLFAEVGGVLKGRATVVAGTGSYSTAESIHLSQEAERLGVDAVMAVVPYYNKPPQEGLYRHFKAIAQAVNVPLILYNVPSRTGLNMTPETVARLSEVNGIVGIKEASGDMDQAARILQQVRPGFLMWSGNDSDNYAIAAMGGYGAVSVASHLVGKQIKRLIGLALDGKTDEAKAEHERLLPLNQGLFVMANPIPVKWAVNHVGFRVGSLRMPLVEPDEKTADFLANLLTQYRIDLPVTVTG